LRAEWVQISARTIAAGSRFVSNDQVCVIALHGVEEFPGRVLPLAINSFAWYQKTRIIAYAGCF
jgi:hypothetical protein